MKIKLNNVFEKIKINKDRIKVSKRRNLNEIEKEKNKLFEDIYETNKITIRRRRTIEKNNTFKDVFNIFKSKLSLRKSYYFLFILMLCLAGVSVYVNFKTYENLNQETYDVFSNSEEKTNTEESSISSKENYQNEITNNTDTRKNDVETSKVVVNNVTETKPKVVPLSFISPLSGEIIKKYSENQVIYSETLESWKTHDGIDIAGNIGDKIKSCEKGIVEKVYFDSFYGNTVVIDHGQGYKSIYSNLDSNVKVKVKQIIKKSEVIGTVGNTAIGEIKDKSHIHFILMFNNKVIDPASKIKF